MNAAIWGIDDHYYDLDGVRRTPPPASMRAIAAAMDAISGEPPASVARFERAGSAAAVGRGVDLETEDGESVRLDGSLPPDLPLGYHRLVDSHTGCSTMLVVAPRACHPPGPRREWGWAAQLYAARSAASWGIGDCADLATLGRWAARTGATWLLLNPLHAPGPRAEEPSPYFPGSRVWRNPLYLRIEEIPGASDSTAAIAPLAHMGTDLNTARFIDRARVLRLKQAALEIIWNPGRPEPAFERWRTERGALLESYAAFMVLSDHYGSGWKAWPEEYRSPASPAVLRFLAAHSERARYHEWVQWLLEIQLQRAAGDVDLIHDLAVGVDSDGFDAWAWHDAFASRIEMGAPPDDFNRGGQRWGVQPFDPHRLRALAYEPFIETVRSALRFGGGLRYDHVMGLFRSFWIPRGFEARDGTYVRYPASDLLDILALESRRAQTFIVGEDLGTVEPGVREELARRGVLSYRLLWFESGSPDEYPEMALAAATNHDLPTVPGLVSGSDLKRQEAAGLIPNRDFAAAMNAKIRGLTGLSARAGPAEVTAAVYDLLGRAPSRIVVATLEDALGVEERPNLPGTTEEAGNWTAALPVTVEEIVAHDGPKRIGQSLARARPTDPGLKGV